MRFLPNKLSSYKVTSKLNNNQSNILKINFWEQEIEYSIMQLFKDSKIQSKMTRLIKSLSKWPNINVIIKFNLNHWNQIVQNFRDDSYDLFDKSINKIISSMMNKNNITVYSINVDKRNEFSNFLLNSHFKYNILWNFYGYTETISLQNLFEIFKKNFNITEYDRECIETYLNQIIKKNDFIVI